MHSNVILTFFFFFFLSMQSICFNNAAMYSKQWTGSNKITRFLEHKFFFKVWRNQRKILCRDLCIDLTRAFKLWWFFTCYVILWKLRNILLFFFFSWIAFFFLFKSSSVTNGVITRYYRRSYAISRFLLPYFTIIFYLGIDILFLSIDSLCDRIITSCFHKSLLITQKIKKEKVNSKNSFW